jgi:hypothetical protein
VPRINLTADERIVLVSWLFETDGYLSIYSIDAGLTAAAALVLDPGLDLVQWKRDNGDSGWLWGSAAGPAATARDSEEMAGLWWVVYVWDGNNIPPPNMPAEYPEWLTYYGEWKQSIIDAFVRVPPAERTSEIVLYNESGVPFGSWIQSVHLDVQVGFFDNAANP